ncbi:hypothetical protein OHB11_04275 [Streptomyces zaomyceticus]|uniref:Lipoprotein n=1 Tax=Streptomyces zaomyceticus TaxID=68286 RepID=A0ABZ1L202_9ACTN|nr:hypothetical protein OG237_37900 [Streptomyces zaomyceticus]
MKIRRTCLAASAVVALLTGAVACTSDAGGPPAAGGAADGAKRPLDTVCASGSYTWFNVSDQDVLVGLAEKQKIGKGGGPLTNKLSLLHTPVTAVTFEKGPRVDAGATLRSLRAHFSDTQAPDLDGFGFADVHRTVPKLASNTTTVTNAGTFVDYAWVRQVTADFRYTCGGKRAVGRATGWDLDGGGVLECSTPIDNAKAGDPASAAARLACGRNSPAARVKKS